MKRQSRRRRADASLPGRVQMRTPGKRSRVQARYGDAPRRSAAESVRAVAAEGTSGAGATLPFVDQIQASFGSHDVGSVRAHSGADAQQASRAIGADAFAADGEVAFAGAPDLHTAAHEAAHVVQQRSSMSLDGGVGAAGDRHEAHADRVADAVVQGTSAESLLDEYSPGAAASGGAVQAYGGAVMAPAPGEGGVGYEGAEGNKPFTVEEERWIHEVMSMELIQLILGTYEVPQAVLHRVDAIGKSSGQTNPGKHDVAIADRVYETENKHYHPEDGEFVESDEESFKGTLLHELFHFIEGNAQATVDGMVMPSELIEVLKYPGNGGYDPYAFGWFQHPVTGLWLHFQLGGVVPDLMEFEESNMSVRGTPLEPIAKDKSRWEYSPMPVSADSISIEEDLCESFSYMLTSQRTMEAFRANYPLRFDLLDRWLGHLAAVRDTAAP